jgi:hypothetical protein
MSGLRRLLDAPFMRHILITILTATALVGGYLLLRSPDVPEGPAVPPRPSAPTTPAEEAPKPPPSRPAPEPVEIPGLPELEALHRQHGRVGDAMRTLLEGTFGRHWNEVERLRMTEAIHQVMSTATADDIPYLLDLFNRIEDPGFRWWFSWLVEQLPDPRFIDAMTEVYRLDPRRGLDALAAIPAPAAKDRYLELLEGETDSAVRRHAIAKLAHTDWEGGEEAIAAIARDRQRAGAERVEALTALGRGARSPEAGALLMDVALGPPQPLEGLPPDLAASHPLADVRSGAVLALMLRGDQEEVRRLIEAADAAGEDSDISRIVDAHLGGYKGPDLTELIYDRVRRRGFVSAGEVHHLIRDLDTVDRRRLRGLIPLVRDPAARDLLDKVASGR